MIHVYPRIELRFRFIKLRFWRVQPTTRYNISPTHENIAVHPFLRLVTLYHKKNGKKVKNPDGKYAASWEERYHKKRHFPHFEDDDNDNAPTA